MLGLRCVAHCCTIFLSLLSADISIKYQLTVSYQEVLIANALELCGTDGESRK